jgi:membrane protease subunit (stomatin/prohibitin family)
MSTITAQITVADVQAAFLQHQATETGKTVEEVVANAIANNQSIQGIVNDRAQQAYWRLANVGNYPAEVIAESLRQADANAPEVTA